MISQLSYCRRPRAVRLNVIKCFERLRLLNTEPRPAHIFGISLYFFSFKNKSKVNSRPIKHFLQAHRFCLDWVVTSHLGLRIKTFGFSSSLLTTLYFMVCFIVFLIIFYSILYTCKYKGSLPYTLSNFSKISFNVCRSVWKHWSTWQLKRKAK